MTLGEHQELVSDLLAARRILTRCLNKICEHYGAKKDILSNISKARTAIDNIYGIMEGIFKVEYPDHAVVRKDPKKYFTEIQPHIEELEEEHR